MANKLRATTLIVSLRQNGVGHDKTCDDAIMPKGHYTTVPQGHDKRLDISLFCYHTPGFFVLSNVMRSFS